MAARLDAAAAELIAACMHDPVLFTQKVVGLEPTAQQREFFAALTQEGARVAVKSGHGTGKSTTLSLAALWFLLMFPNALVPCTAPTAHQLQDVLWREIRQCVDRMQPWWRDQISITEDRVRLAGSGGMIVARTARPEKPDALQGFHAQNILFLIDEAPGVPDTVFEVARGALSTPSAKVAMTGNPTRLSGYFHAAFHANRDTWTRITFSCLDSPLVGEQYARDMAAEYGEDSDVFRTRVLGEFPRHGLYSLISPELAQNAMERTLPLHAVDHAPKIFGVDPAWLGTDRSAIFHRQGLHSELLFCERGVDTGRLSTITAQLSQKYAPDAVFIDQTGVGAGVVDQCRSLGLPVVAVAFGGTPTEPERFANRRAEMWWKVREWLEQGGCLPGGVGDLLDDLTGPEFRYTVAGKVQLEGKDEMRKRGIASPDLGDALALTFAAPVQRRGRQAARKNTYSSTFNPYDWMKR